MQYEVYTFPVTAIENDEFIDESEQLVTNPKSQIGWSWYGLLCASLKSDLYRTGNLENRFFPLKIEVTRP